MTERNEAVGRDRESEGPHAKITAYATILLVVLTYLILAYGVHWWPFRPSNPVTPPIGPDFDAQVENALLAPSDLASFNGLTFSSADQAIVTNNSCRNWTITPSTQKARQLTSSDSSVLAFESISVFQNANDARAAFEIDQNQLTCISGIPGTGENISSEAQTCDATAATDGSITLSGSNVAGEEYTAEVRCGRALTILEFAAADSSPFNGKRSGPWARRCGE